MDRTEGKGSGPLDAAALAQLEAIAALGMLSAGVTHEVRNAMTGILGFAQVARRKLGAASGVDDVLGLIEQELLRCLDLLDSYLSTSRHSNGEDELIAIDVNAVVAAASRLLRDTFSERRVKLRMQLGEGLLAVQGNPNALKQVVLNLAINALHASAAEDEVVVETAHAGNRIAIVVHDRGLGIEAENLERIFDPFFTTKSQDIGTGLGLWVSRGIVERYGGALRVTSDPGRGSTFTVELPTSPVGDGIG